MAPEDDHSCIAGLKFRDQGDKVRIVAVERSVKRLYLGVFSL
jgi:hypothetical protein